MSLNTLEEMQLLRFFDMSFFLSICDLILRLKRQCEKAAVSWQAAEAATGGRAMAFWEIYFWASNYFHCRSLCPTCFPKKALGGTANIYAANQRSPPSIHLCVVK